MEIGNMNAQIKRERIFQKMAGKESFHLKSNNNRLTLVSFSAYKAVLI